jgi:methyltransferase-like protein
MKIGYDLLKCCVPVVSCRKQRNNNDFLIVMSEEGEVYYLNDTAKFIYSCFDRKNTISDILNIMKEKYEAENEDDEKILINDLVELIRDFQWQNIIKITEE